jgi:hypothetical protein
MELISTAISLRKERKCIFKSQNRLMHLFSFNKKEEELEYILIKAVKSNESMVNNDLGPKGINILSFQYWIPFYIFRILISKKTPEESKRDYLYANVI